jgi:hypothetical protein
MTFEDVVDLCLNTIFYKVAIIIIIIIIIIIMVKSKIVL